MTENSLWLVLGMLSTVLLFESTLAKYRYDTNKRITRQWDF